MQIVFVLPLLFAPPAAGFVPVSLSSIHHHASTKSSSPSSSTSSLITLNAYEQTMAEEKLNNKLEHIGHKLRLQVYDVTTGVYGLESKDPLYGIENIRTRIPIDPALGLELTELAHSSQGHSEDDRGLVLVSKVVENSAAAAASSKIQVGDTIVGVFCEGAEFKESVTGLDYEATMDVITRAKTHAHMMAGWDGGATISLELNRLVPRAKVQVIVEGAADKPTTIEGLAGDNLRMLLMHHQIDLYDKKLHRLDQPSVTGSNCGGEGICATCMVKILEGGESLNKAGPKEEEITTGRPVDWRAACQTVLGADNQESTLRVQIHPEWAKDRN